MPTTLERASRTAERLSEIKIPQLPLREHGLTGTPEEIADRIAEFAGIGASRVYLQVLDLDDLDHLELLAELIPAVS